MQNKYCPPSNDTEKAIVNVFEKVFNQEKIGVYDDFNKLGGDSLSSIKVISLLSQMGIKINANVILNYRTPYNIAKYINENLKTLDDNLGFDLVKKGETDQNMFLLPPIEGLSSVFPHLIDNIHFDRNIYLIDDFQV